ncbi:MAG: hypothetical protein KatS3mg070_1888 [Meiothermus sp.]|nr:MAG: hypothetical protein KatS3mg070_1888 [Meiothermus sp.]
MTAYWILAVKLLQVICLLTAAGMVGYIVIIPPLDTRPFTAAGVACSAELRREPTWAVVADEIGLGHLRGLGMDDLPAIPRYRLSSKFLESLRPEVRQVVQQLAEALEPIGTSANSEVFWWEALNEKEAKIDQAYEMIRGQHRLVKTELDKQNRVWKSRLQRVCSPDYPAAALRIVGVLVICGLLLTAFGITLRFTRPA